MLSAFCTVKNEQHRHKKLRALLSQVMDHLVSKKFPCSWVKSPPLIEVPSSNAKPFSHQAGNAGTTTSLPRKCIPIIKHLSARIESITTPQQQQLHLLASLHQCSLVPHPFQCPLHLSHVAGSCFPSQGCRYGLASLVHRHCYCVV
jgi:hypothetical protein